jgi:hypothetical protein
LPAVTLTKVGWNGVCRNLGLVNYLLIWPYLNGWKSHPGSLWSSLPMGGQSLSSVDVF